MCWKKSYDEPFHLCGIRLNLNNTRHDLLLQIARRSIHFLIMFNSEMKEFTSVKHLICCIYNNYTFYANFIEYFAVFLHAFLRNNAPLLFVLCSLSKCYYTTHHDNERRKGDRENCFVLAKYVANKTSLRRALWAGTFKNLLSLKVANNITLAVN